MFADEKLRSRRRGIRFDGFLNIDAGHSPSRLGRIHYSTSEPILKGINPCLQNIQIVLYWSKPPKGAFPMNPSILERARALLADVTPLKTDCGLLCAHACCLPDEDGQGGVYLFPGERALTGDWGDVVHAELLPGVPADMLICHGPCDRGLRPLACRMFPLTPIRRKDGSWSARVDRRAFAMCPLAPHGVAGLSPEFIAAVKQAVALIASDEEGRQFLDAWRRLEKQFADAAL